MPAEEVKSMEPLLKKELGLISVLIIGGSEPEMQDLQSQLEECGFVYYIAPGNLDAIFEYIYRPDINVILISEDHLPSFARAIKQEKAIPIIGIFSSGRSTNAVVDRSIDDFIITPYKISELVTRIKRLVQNNNTPSSELLTVGDLVIDLAKFEVSVGGKHVLLTYKEFELLKFLVTNQGRVFTRETLLNKVWGFDYFGGDRTVDVHIRRLRSKIEDANHSYIETVRSIGYRFKEDIDQENSKT